jgi:hypothetical protein
LVDIAYLDKRRKDEIVKMKLRRKMIPSFLFKAAKKNK